LRYSAEVSCGGTENAKVPLRLAKRIDYTGGTIVQCKSWTAALTKDPCRDTRHTLSGGRIRHAADAGLT